MDLRVYVDGIARIICDLTRTTTVHDIIIALAQYKGKAGRYSLIERAPDGTQRTLSPNEFTYDLNHHPDWIYILIQNPSSTDLTNKRSKSLDGRKTPQQAQSIAETVTSSLSSSSTSGHFRTVNHPSHTFSSSSSSSLKSADRKKRSNLYQIFPSANVNNNNNNPSINSNEDSLPISYLLEQKRSSRTPIQIIEQDLGTLDNYPSNRRPRPKSAFLSTLNENSAFHIVHNPENNHVHIQQQQQQYIALLKVLKSQELQSEQQQKELHEKQTEIEYREKIIEQNDIEKEFQRLAEQDRRLCSEEYIANELEKEYECKKKLHSNYEHLQDKLARSSSNLDQKQQLQEQIQLKIEQTHGDIEQMQAKINAEKKEINQYQHDLQCLNTTYNQQEDLGRVYHQRNEEIERSIDHRRQQIVELEKELIKLDELLMNTFPHPCYHFRSTSSTPQHYNSLPSTGTPTDVLAPVRLQFVNSTLWKLCPSGIWV